MTLVLDGLWRFHHVGLACRDIDAERPGVEALGYTAETGKIVDPIQGVSVQFLIGEGPRLELIEPSRSPSPIDGFLKRGVKMYHLGFETSDFDERIIELEARGYRALGAPAPAVAFDMRRIVFLGSGTMNIIELIADH